MAQEVVQPDLQAHSLVTSNSETEDLSGLEPVEPNGYPNLREIFLGKPLHTIDLPEVLTELGTLSDKHIYPDTYHAHPSLDANLAYVAELIATEYMLRAASQPKEQAIQHLTFYQLLLEDLQTRLRHRNQVTAFANSDLPLIQRPFYQSLTRQWKICQQLQSRLELGGHLILENTLSFIARQPKFASGIGRNYAARLRTQFDQNLALIGGQVETGTGHPYTQTLSLIDLAISKLERKMSTSNQGNHDNELLTELRLARDRVIEAILYWEDIAPIRTEIVEEQTSESGVNSPTRTISTQIVFSSRHSTQLELARLQQSVDTRKKREEITTLLITNILNAEKPLPYKRLIPYYDEGIITLKSLLPLPLEYNTKPQDIIKDFKNLFSQGALNLETLKTLLNSVTILCQYEWGDPKISANFIRILDHLYQNGKGTPPFKIISQENYVSFVASAKRLAKIPEQG